MDQGKIKSNKFNIYNSITPKLQNFPNLGSPNNYKYKNFSTQRKKLNRASSDFEHRNYNTYLEKLKNQNNFSMLHKSDLTYLLYKLKSYNNQVVTYINAKKKSIKDSQDLLKLSEFKLNKLKELQDIDLPDEKISVKNFNELKMSKADIEKRLNFLLKEKEDINYLLKNEIENNKTIEYLYENEQTRLKTTKKKN